MFGCTVNCYPNKLNWQEFTNPYTYAIMELNMRKYFYGAALCLFVLVGLYFQQDAEVSADRHLYPADYAFIKRTFPYYKADKNALLRARQMWRAQRRPELDKTNIPQWTFLGPRNVGGRVVDIEYDPKNPEQVYAASATGGVFKSTDGGGSWFPVFDDQPILTIGDIGIDPTHPDTVYVGTGEANGGHNNFPGAGVYRSTDGGASWRLMGLENTTSIGRVVVDPRNSARVWVAAVGSYFAPDSFRGLYVSDDYGMHWRKSLFVSDSTGAIDLVVHPQHTDTLFCAMWERVRRPVESSGTHLYGPTGGIFRSYDGGQSWTKLGVGNGLPDATGQNIGRIGLAMAPSRPSTLYALYNDGSNLIGLYRSDDLGENWRNVDADNELANGTAGFSWYFGQVRVHPRSADTVFVQDVAFMRSVDGGANWPLIYGYGGPTALHVDQHALAFHPQHPDTILSGNDGGINISYDMGSTWQEAVLLPVTQFYEIGLDARNPERLYGGTQDNGTNRTYGGLENWEHIFGGDGFYVSVDPRNPDNIYAESQWGNLYYSRDGGLSWSYGQNGIDGSEPTNWSTPVVMDTAQNRVLYYGTDHLYRSTDGAQNWTRISDDLTRQLEDSRVGTITTIAVSPLSSDVIWVGTDDGMVWVSTDYGSSWNSVGENLPFRWVTRVAPDPHNVNGAYVIYSGLRWKDPQPHIFKTDDNGATWTDISTDLPDAPLNAIEVDRQAPGYIYVGSDIGTYYSKDDGAHWQLLGQGLPAVVVNDMKIHPQTHTLVAGTHGRGMYGLNLDTVTGLNPSPVVPESPALLTAWPNPFNPSATVTFTLAKVTDVRLDVFNVRGQKVRTLWQGRAPSGVHKKTFNAQGLATGVYVLSLSETPTGQILARKRITYLK